MKGNLPKGWKSKTLADIGTIVAGGTPSTTDESNFDGDIPWITPADLSSFCGKYIERGRRNISEKGLRNSSAKKLPKGTILFSTRAPIGYIAIAANQVTTNQGFKNLILDDEVIPEYVFYFLKYHADKLNSFASGTTFLEISASRFARIPIIVPPLETQRKIVTILNKTEENKMLGLKAKELTYKLLQSAFLEMFGDPIKNDKKWAMMKLKDITEKIQDGTHFSPKQTSGTIPYVTAKNIRPWGIDLTEVTYVTEEFHRSIYSRCDPKKGDVIYIKDGATAGLGKVNTLNIEFTMLSSIAMIRPKMEVLDPYYLEVFLNHPSVKKRILERKSGSAITRMILKEIREIDIMVPDYKLQNRFGIIARSIENNNCCLNKINTESINLSNLLMASAFTGELVA